VRRPLILLLLVAAPAAAAADVEADDLPQSPHDLDAELTKIDPARATADVLRGLGIRGRFDHFDDVDAFAAVTTPANPRIIDIDRMRARDCVFDRIRGGMCVLRGLDDVDRVDVDAYGAGNAQRIRYEILERILDSVDSFR
jgi:hypothetical protein